mgnify:CR=1 FL=1
MKYRMILTKLLYFLLAFSGKGNDTTYYKIIYHKNKKGCVEANITQRVANTFNAIPGFCYKQNCTIYKGTYTLPFCCKVHGYECIE